MQIVRSIPALALIALLAACASTTNPNSEPPVDEPAPTTPGDVVPYGGQWQVVFTADDDTSFAHLLDITTAYNDDQQDGGFGSQHLCTGQGTSPCDETANDDTGVAFIGTITGADGTAPLSLVIYDKNGRKVYTTGNLSTSTDAQGRQVLSGPAIWVTQPGQLDGTPGTVTATNTTALQAPTPGDPVPDGTLSGTWKGSTNLATLGNLESGFFLTQASSTLIGEMFIFPEPGHEISVNLQGAVTNTFITLIAEVPFKGEDLFFTYQGRLSGTTLSGQVTVQPVDGSGTPEQGTFAVSKSAE